MLFEHMVMKLLNREIGIITTGTYENTELPPLSNVGNRSGMLDIELENDMLRGMPSNTSKSYGYRNPSEHYFEYVDPRYTNMNLFPRFGKSTRDNNKKYGNKYKRDIY